MAHAHSLFVLVLLALAACTTTPTPDPLPPEVLLGRLQAACEQGEPGACESWGDALLEHGDRLQAEGAYGRACEAGSEWSCLTQGRLLMERGDLESAEPPLRKAREAELEAAYEALAELHEARGGPGDREAAARLRWDALALDKPLAEVAVGYRSGVGGVGVDVVVNVQPMLLLSRRLSLGLHAAGGEGFGELNGFIAYQYYASTWVVPYARLLAGSVTQERRESRLNLGGEVGVKLCAGPLGHLHFGMGSSRGSPFHVTVGIGVNAILLLLR